ncbi:MAG TPA: hypothetical protein VJB57_15825 [Dehalococcoidia bacterium]|nr:hypothetical protein [Dehalococcoidia bacterium]
MRKLLIRRRPTELLLDGAFAVWAVSILMTGNVLPSVLTSIFHDDSPAVAISEPAEEPALAPEIVLPET